MTSIEFGDGEVLVDAAVIAKGLKLKAEAVQEMMRRLHHQSVRAGNRRGLGCFRLTFFTDNRRFRLVVNEAGRIIQRLGVDFGDRPMPASARIPGR